jgi:curved DNA-binding protein CbpA
MINELNHHFASLRQKAITIPSMVQKLDSLDSEIAQFSFFLNVLRTPQLITLLTSKDFVQLHGLLEKLHTTFKTFEPSISAQKPTHTVSTDDPYMVLGLPYNASDAEITAKYTELAGQLSPDVVEQQLKAQGCEPKVCKKMVNAARRTFALTKNAYDSLTQNKTAIDKYLQDKMARESRKEMTSLRAFDSVIAGLTSAITQDRILQQVQQLLEKHKPEELAQMKAQIDLEKKVYERSKKRIQIQQARPSSRPQAPYESFYKKMAQQRPPTPIKPTYAGATPSSDKRSQKESTAKEEGRGPEGKKDKKADGKKEDKKDSKDGKKDGGKKDGRKPVAKKDATPPVEPTKEDIERLTELGSVGKLLDTAKKQKEIDVTYKVRGAPMVQKEDLTKIMGRLDAELTSGTPEIQDAAKNLQEYFTTINLEGIEKALKKAAPGKGQKLSGLPAQYWKDNVVKYKDLVEQWHTTVARRLSALDRNNYNLGAAKPVKMRQHGLHENNIDPWLTLKDDESPPERDIEPGNVDLWKIRSSINAICTYINETGVV